MQAEWPVDGRDGTTLEKRSRSRCYCVSFSVSRKRSRESRRNGSGAGRVQGQNVELDTRAWIPLGGFLRLVQGKRAGGVRGTRLNRDYTRSWQSKEKGATRRISPCRASDVQATCWTIIRDKTGNGKCRNKSRLLIPGEFQKGNTRSKQVPVKKNRSGISTVGSVRARK